MYVKTLSVFIAYIMSSPLHWNMKADVIEALGAASFYGKAVGISMSLLALTVLYRLRKGPELTDNEGFQVALAFIMTSAPGFMLLFVELERLKGAPPLFGVLVTGAVCLYFIVCGVALVKKPQNVVAEN